MLDVKLVDGDLQPYNTFISGDDLIIQRATIRFRTHRGEWLLDESAGIPLVAWAEQRGLSINAVVLQAREEIEGIPGVIASDLTGVWDYEARSHSVSGTATLASRRVVSFAVSPYDVLGQPATPVLGV